MKLTRKFYRRYGDKASCRDWSERYILSDGSTLGISISLVLYPRFKNKFQWYLGISNSGDRIGRIANSWRNYESSKLWKNQIKQIIELALFSTGKITNNNWKVREKIINSWFNKILEN